MLRVGTEAAHQDVELRSGLPDSISNLADYRSCLLHFYQLYRPMESQFQSFDDWMGIGLESPGRGLSTRLAVDLRALGVSVEEIRDAPSTSLQALATFEQALGACYVMEGSALGSQFMLPHLQKTLGEQMIGADSFFRGRGSGTGAFWKGFKLALDLYGTTHPARKSSVVAGAIATFEAVGDWMKS
jgi:heme oxygenase